MPSVQHEGIRTTVQIVSQVMKFKYVSQFKCRTQTCIVCETCNVRLCKMCWNSYHTDEVPTNPKWTSSQADLAATQKKKWRFLIIYVPCKLLFIQTLIRFFIRIQNRIRTATTARLDFWGTHPGGMCWNKICTAWHNIFRTPHGSLGAIAECITQMVVEHHQSI